VVQDHLRHRQPRGPALAEANGIELSKRGRIPQDVVRPLQRGRQLRFIPNSNQARQWLRRACLLLHLPQIPAYLGTLLGVHTACQADSYHAPQRCFRRSGSWLESRPSSAKRRNRDVRPDPSECHLSAVQSISKPLAGTFLGFFYPVSDPANLQRSNSRSCINSSLIIIQPFLS